MHRRRPAQKKRRLPKEPPHPCSLEKADQRLENWKLRRALALPYFWRSTTRPSRVRKTACLTAERRDGSYGVSAWAMPRLIAPRTAERSGGRGVVHAM